MKRSFQQLGLVFLIASCGAGVWFFGKQAGTLSHDGPLDWTDFLSIALPWSEADVDFETRTHGNPTIVPISTFEEFRRVSGMDAFWRFEFGVRWPQANPKERIQVLIQCVDADERLVSTGQIVTMKKLGTTDPEGRTWYRPELDIVIVPTPALERITVDRLGICFQEGGQWQVTIVD
jgi:hypothetical protein